MKTKHFFLLIFITSLFGCKEVSPEEKSLENCKKFVEEKLKGDSNFEIKNSDVSNLDEIKFDSENGIPKNSEFHVSVIFSSKQYKSNMIFCFCDDEGEILGSEEFLGVNE